MRLYGFSLIEMAIALVIMGQVAGLYLMYSSHSNSTECYSSTQTELTSINLALQNFAAKNDRYPRPADRRLASGDPQYGREATTAEVAAGAIDTVNGALYGALPFQSLGMNENFAADCWANKFTYVVTANFAKPGTPPGTGDLRDETMPGVITVKSNASNALITDAAYAVISHGQDALGAVKVSYRGTDKKWCTVPSPNPGIKSYNCDPSSHTIMAAAFNEGKNNDEYFDDVVVFYGRPIVPTVDGGWSLWSACVNGTKIHSCTNPAPKPGGMQCIGPKTTACP